MEHLVEQNPQHQHPQIQVPSQAKLVMELCKPAVLFTPIWANMIQPVVDEFARCSSGEYTTYDVFLSLHSGASLLYIGHLDDSAKTFVGYVILELVGRKGAQQDGPNVWQTFIKDEYRGGPYLFEGFSYIQAEVRKLGAKSVYAVANNAEICTLYQRMGFTEVVRSFTLKKQV